MIKNLLVRNLRSLRDTGFVALSPVTLLVGKNNSGKSTFLRTLPLLKQSVETRTRGPILWFGNPVDFGDYETAITHNDDHQLQDQGITFGFELALPSRFEKSELRDPLSRRYRISFLKPATCRVYLTVKSIDDATYASQIELYLYDSHCSLEFSGPDELSCLRVNDYIYRPGENELVVTDQDFLFPRLRFLRLRATKSKDEEASWRLMSTPPFYKDLYRAVRQCVHGKTSGETIHRMIDQMRLGPANSFKTHLRRDIDAPATWKEGRFLAASDYERIRNRLFAYKFTALTQIIDREVTRFLSGVRYLEPLRATAQRYYRNQDLAIDEIDSQGANIAMFLDSLDYDAQCDFSRWTSESFGFQVRTIRSGGHLEMKLKSSDSNFEENLADMGFGFSQLLPIAAQLWVALDSRHSQHRPYRSNYHPSCIALEQPELHLHPELQAKIANVMARMIELTRNNRRPISIVVETHSQSIVNRFGQLIAKGQLRDDDVSVILFEKNEEDGLSSIRTSSFDKSGRLTNWPFGFFEPA